MDESEEQRKADERFLNLIHYRGTPENSRLLQEVLRAGANVNAREPNGGTALHRVSYAGWRDERKFCRLLLDAGADPCAVDKNGNTPLHLIADMNCTNQFSRQCVVWLIEAGADVNAEDKSGYTPLEFAASNNDVPLIALLLTHRARLGMGSTKNHQVIVDHVRDMMDRGELEAESFSDRANREPRGRTSR